MSDAQLQAKCEEFYGAIYDNGLPLGPIYTSGGASIHALVRLNAEDENQWRERQKLVYEYCAKMPGWISAVEWSRKLAKKAEREGFIRIRSRKYEFICR